MRKIPRVMSTQHPDNVSLPFFAETPDMSGEDEIQEAYYAFSHLGCDEQMWDSEGKEVDDFVVKKLLTRYPHFFKERRLGEDCFLTLRVPNPSVEREEAKILVEALESIPRSMDAACLFYGQDCNPPIFEVILPMTTSARELNRVYYFYRRFISEKQYQPIYEGDITLAEWVGEFRPESIQVIPLFEDIPSMLRAPEILEEYLRDKDFSYLRVFLARSDPALNYGSLAAVLANKLTLRRLQDLASRLEIEIYPILGAGSPPFRGNLSPATVEQVLREYPCVETFTVQSAFKYDHPIEEVISAIKKILNFVRYPLDKFDENLANRIIEKTSREYRRLIEVLAPLVNRVARDIPRRRMRKLHVGLFGYSRSLGKVTLPRAIGFCGACYSLGLPPEILGLNVLEPQELSDLRPLYRGLEADLSRALQYFNSRVLEVLPEEVRRAVVRALEVVNTLSLEVRPDPVHQEATSRILSRLKEKYPGSLADLIVEAAYRRRFLG